MSRRKPEPVVVEPVLSEPMREKVAPEDSKAFQPSSFASRKAQAEANSAKLAERRLVSLGVADFPQRNLKTGELEAVEVEMFTDLDHPVDRWVQFPGPHGLVPLQDHVGNNDKVVRHTLKRPLGRPATSTYVVAQPEAPPRPV